MANVGIKVTANSSDYQNKMKQMVAQMKEMKSEFSLTATNMKLFGTQSDVLKTKVESLTNRVELQKKIVQANSEQYERLSDKLKDQRSKHEELAKKVDDAQKAYKESAKATGEDSEQTKKLKENLEQLQDELKTNEQSLAKQESQLSKQKTKLNNSNKALAEMSKELEVVAQKLKTAGLDEFAEKCEKVSKSAEDVARKTAALSGTVAVVETYSAKAAMSFEDAMAKVTTIMDENVMSQDSMKKAIIDLSNETGIAAEDIADNVYNAISAGQSTADAVNFVRESTKLATAGFADSASSLDILTTIMNAYGLEASEVTKVSDMLIQTQNLGKTTVAELSSSMGKVIPTANAYGVKLDQVSASYVKLTANGISTHESTTYLNAMLNELGKTGTNADKVLREKTGKSFAMLMESGMSLGDVLAILDKEAKSQNKQFADMFSSSEAAKAGLVLIKDGADGFNKTLTQMNDSTGMTDEAFKKMQTDSFKIKLSMNELKNTAIEFGTAIMTSLEPTITSVREKISNLTKWFNSLDDSTKQNIAKAGMFVAAISPVAFGISKIAKGVKSAINTYKLFHKAGSNVIKMLKSEKAAQIATKVAQIASTAATKAATIAQTAFTAVMNANPIMKVVMAITALVAAVVIAYNKCEWFRNLVNSIFEWIKNAVVNVAASLSSAWETVKTVTMNVWNAIGTAVTNVWNAITNVVKVGIDLIVSIVQAAFTLITLPWQFIWVNCKDTIVNIWNAISTTVSNVINTIKNVIQNVMTAIMNICSTIWNSISSTVSVVWNAISTTISTVMNTIRNVVTSVWNAISSTVSSVVNGIKTIVTNVWNAISSTVSGVLNTIRSTVSNVWNSIKSTVSSVVNSIKSTVSSVWNSMYSSVSGTMNSIKSAISNVWNSIKSTVSSVVNSIKSTVSSVFNGIKNTISGAMNSAKSVVSGAIDKIKGFFNFKVSFPKIKLPHFKVKGSANPLKWLDEGVPKLTVEWYANGGIMTRPTAFAMAGNRVLAGGEAGAEAILPLSYFYEELARIIDEKIAKIRVQAYFKVEAHTYIGDEEVANKTAVKVNEILAEEYEGVR